MPTLVRQLSLFTLTFSFLVFSVGPEELSLGFYSAFRMPVDLGDSKEGKAMFPLQCQEVTEAPIARGEYLGPYNSFSRDGKFVAIQSSEQVTVLETDSGRQVLTLSYGKNLCVTFNRAADRVMIRTTPFDLAEGKTTLHFFSLPDGKLVRQFTINAGPNTLIIPSERQLMLAILEPMERKGFYREYPWTKKHLSNPPREHSAKFPINDSVYTLKFRSAVELALEKHSQYLVYPCDDIGLRLGGFFFQQNGLFAAGILTDDLPPAEKAPEFPDVGRKTVLLSPQTGDVVRIEDTQDLAYSAGLEGAFSFRKGHFQARVVESGKIQIDLEVPENDLMCLRDPYSPTEILINPDKDIALFTAITQKDKKIKTLFVAWNTQTYQERYRFERSGAWTAKDELFEAGPTSHRSDSIYYFSEEEVGFRQAGLATPEDTSLSFVLGVSSGKFTESLERRSAMTEEERQALKLVDKASFDRALAALKLPELTSPVTLETSSWILPDAVLLISNSRDDKNPRLNYAAVVDLRYSEPRKLFEGQFATPSYLVDGLATVRSYKTEIQDFTKVEESAQFLLGKKPGATPFPLGHELLDKAPGIKGLRRVLMPQLGLLDGQSQEFFDPAQTVGTILESKRVSGTLFLLSQSPDGKATWLTRVSEIRVGK